MKKMANEIQSSFDRYGTSWGQVSRFYVLHKIKLLFSVIEKSVVTGDIDHALEGINQVRSMIGLMPNHLFSKIVFDIMKYIVGVCEKVQPDRLSMSLLLEGYDITRLLFQRTVEADVPIHDDSSFRDFFRVCRKAGMLDRLDLNSLEETIYYLLQLGWAYPPTEEEEGSHYIEGALHLLEILFDEIPGHPDFEFFAIRVVRDSRYWAESDHFATRVLQMIRRSFPQLRIRVSFDPKLRERHIVLKSNGTYSVETGDKSEKEIYKWIERQLRGRRIYHTVEGVNVLDL